MSQDSSDQNVQESGRAARLHEIKTGATWFLALGVVLIVVGMMAIGSSFVATLATVMAFGILLLVGGVMQVAGSLVCRQWSGFFLHLLAGIFYVIVGLLMINHPIKAAAGLTLMLAVFLLVGGTFRIAVALIERFQNWGWVLANGIITLLLGIMIWRQLPEASAFVIGLFVGIELVFTGWSWVMLGMSVRSLAKQGTQAVEGVQ